MHDGGLEALATDRVRFEAKFGGEGSVDIRHRVHEAVGCARVAPVMVTRGGKPSISASDYSDVEPIIA